MLDVMLAEGVRVPVTAFREGFSRVFPIWDLQAFSTGEMLTIFGNPDEDWSFESEFRCISLCHYVCLTTICKPSWML